MRMGLLANDEYGSKMRGGENAGRAAGTTGSHYAKRDPVSQAMSNNMARGGGPGLQAAASHHDIISPVQEANNRLLIGTDGGASFNLPSRGGPGVSAPMSRPGAGMNLSQAGRDGPGAGMMKPGVRTGGGMPM